MDELREADEALTFMARYGRIMITAFTTVVVGSRLDVF